MNEQALVESQSLREQYADRVEVLDKVKALRKLKGSDHVTSEIVAEYYEVPVETIKSIVKNNRAELTRNGHNVLRGQDARSFADLASLSPSITQLALFSRRAVLSVGMLLRDSQVAQAVRTELLDAEERDAGLAPAETAAVLPSRKQLAYMVIEAEERAEVEAARADIAEVRAETAERKFAEFEGGPGITPTKFHKKYFSDVPAKVFFDHLYTKGYLIDQRGQGAWDERRECYRDGPQHFEPSYKGKPYLYLHEAGVYGGKRRFKTYVRPGNPELLFKAQLMRDGLRGNMHTNAHLFAIEGGAS